MKSTDFDGNSVYYQIEGSKVAISIGDRRRVATFKYPTWKRWDQHRTNILAGRATLDGMLEVLTKFGVFLLNPLNAEFYELSDWADQPSEQAKAWVEDPSEWRARTT